MGKAKIPRPPNAFILYRKHQHPVVKANCPGIINNDISKKVAMMWEAEGEEGRAVWKAKADEVKKEHMKKYPGYSYQPRKPSEKKRRMTKKKAAALQSKTAVPSFALHSTDPMMVQHTLGTDPMMVQHTLGTDPAAIEMFGKMIDQHNDSNLLVDYEDLSVFSSSAVLPGQFGQALEGQRTMIDVENSASSGDFVGQFWTEDLIPADDTREFDRHGDYSSRFLDFVILNNDRHLRSLGSKIRSQFLLPSDSSKSYWM
ncbi:hypothetical protein EJ08DRAFT_584522 [Tothia fuscella]|uniref:HMG box domain-containing protein n=1 Tax=Tothia fuscella TaxID=1048955 RepID=A0A9P4NXM5_9PEZI|nr:hypothetical protein EJ08DRAFT_584522 [Tothia fuscella]